MLSFDIESIDLQRIGEQLGATPKQVRNALGRALRRTEASLRRLSSKGLSEELQLRTVTALRKRLRSIKVKSKDGQVGLWYGLNPLPVSSFKGRPTQEDGGSWFGEYYFKDSFVARSNYKGRNSIFMRKGKQRLPIIEQGITISDRAIVFIEDEIFVQTETIFWQHFKRDLAARVNFQLGER
jgi:hypothetical protein